MKNEIFEIKLLFSKVKLEFLCLNYQKKINTIAIYKIIQKRGYFIMKIITNCKDVKKLAEINYYLTCVLTGYCEKNNDIKEVRSIYELSQYILSLSDTINYIVNEEDKN